MRHSLAYAFLMLAVLFAGCSEARLSEDFEMNGQLRIEIKGYTVFSYAPATCQLGFNRETCEFRVHTDNMSDFFVIDLDEMPSAEGQKIKGSASWTTGDNLHVKKTIFEVVKIQDSRIWLWSSESRIAAVVLALD